MSIFYSPELLYLDGAFVSGKGLLVDEHGCIQCVRQRGSWQRRDRELTGKWRCCLVSSMHIRTAFSV